MNETTIKAESVETASCAGGEDLLAALVDGHEVTEDRRGSLMLAIRAGADAAALATIRDATRVSRKSTILLPCQRFENLSRGKGWARKGKGNSAEWGEREDGKYRVGAGRWTVGGNDGFSRKGEDTWDVENVTVGTETWTVAS